MKPDEVRKIYEGSNGDATRALYKKLEELGPAGVIALNLFRACKCSERAKVYRGKKYHDAAYDRKQWSLDNLCKALTENAKTFDIKWGWGLDKQTEKYPHVVYIETPTGQVNFHNVSRGIGPDFDGQWDRVVKQAPARISQWCSDLLTGTPSNRPNDQPAPQQMKQQDFEYRV